MTQLAVSGATVTLGSSTIFEDVTFTVAAGERWGVIGRNGTGKSTLFRLLTGALAPARGSVVRHPGVRISLLEQHHDFGGAATVWEAAASGLGELMLLGERLQDMGHALAAGDASVSLDGYGQVLERFEHGGGYAAPARVDAVLDGLGFDPARAKRRPLAALSGGERGRLALARELVRSADILLLDEPTNHLDLDTARWLEQYLAEAGRTLLLVSHDRAFLANLADHILHFEGGTATPYTGGYRSFVLQRAERRLTQERAVDRQRKAIAAEEDYIRRNIAGQNSRQAKGRRKRLERLPRLGAPGIEPGAMGLRLESSERGGDLVVVADKALLSRDATVLLEDFTGSIRRGDRVALIGPNGSGKSTMLNVLMGDLPLNGGTLRLGGGITPAYYRQDLTQLPLDGTPMDVIQGLRPMWDRGALQQHLGRFGFSGDEVMRRIASFSGGERARLALAALVLRDANLLVLDEPTNHLDVESVEALEDALDAYPGTVLVVSHDREMLRSVATRVWSLRNRCIEIYDGPFGEWEAFHEARVAEAQVPARPAKAAPAPTRPTGEAPSRRDAERAARKATAIVQATEREAAALEERIALLTETLADPALYADSFAGGRAAKLAEELEHLRGSLEEAVTRWTEAMEMLSRAEAHFSVERTT